ncbi:unnamed protein product [Parnassius apollo]|uniref:(apollo) hypothetical protein n=1 Tax=Parnassius apollo TaxID=110799 RepID=A0A8S3WMN5_PARAO|nr:unnamed protein product [Parnassius apollo]
MESLQTSNQSFEERLEENDETNDVELTTESINEGGLLPLSLNENINNLDSVIQQYQKINYPNEFRGIVTDLGRSLGVFKDKDDILRCKGRMILADLSYDQKCPILLPKNCKLTEHIIKSIHEENYHVGTSHTLNLIRQKYWIPQGRSQVQKVIKKCFQCQKYGGGPYKLPLMPDFPAERVNYENSFTYMGLDYLGPLLISNDRKEKHKMWICIYTCLVTRAIHLEVVQDLTTEQCALALRRFFAARGISKLILSDNASQYKLTADACLWSLLFRK